MSEVIKIANCSGFYGDNLSIAKKMDKIYKLNDGMILEHKE